jgi:CRP-like cAMP-binding protein
LVLHSVAVRKLEHGATLTDEDRRRIDQALEDLRVFSRGEDIICEGDRPDDAHVVLEGFACRYKVVRDGGRQIMGWLVPGDFCDLQVHLLGRMDHSIAALTACRVARVPPEAVVELTRHERISQALRWATLVDEAVLREWMVGMGRRPADRQIAHLICELLYRLRSVGLAEGDRFEFPVTQEEVADTVGMSSVHVNRVLQQLRAEGMIGQQGRVLIVLDEPRLCAFADFDPNYLHLTPRSNVA